MKKKVGVIAMFKLDKGGGAPKVTADLINILNSIGKEVYLLNPFKPNYKKIEEFYGQIKIKRKYDLGKIGSFFCRGSVLPRRLMKKEFRKMANEVDFIFDIDGGILHKYLPKTFDNNNYVIWRISSAKPNSRRYWIKKNIKEKIKEKILDILGEKKCTPSTKHKVYAIDKWTAKELRENLNINSEKIYLYPKIEVNDLILRRNNKKKNQIVVFGRIAPNKNIDDSVKIFAHGTKDFQGYKLIILGGATSETEDYTKRLKKLADELGILKRIEIIKNPSFKKIREILQNSKGVIDSQREISLTITSIEAMAAGNIVLGYKNSGGYRDILEEGKYGYGFLDIKEGGGKLKEILDKLENKKINNKKSIKRAMEFSDQRFKKTIKKILNENGV